MKKILFTLFVASLTLAGCGGSPEATSAAPTPDINATVQSAVSTALAAQPTASPTPFQPVTATPVVVMPTAQPVQVSNDLVSPVLHHADSQPPENGVGSFDVGVKNGQIGLAFGWHIAWPKGGVDAGGNGCDLVILTPGWYENLAITDGRYEVYDVPSGDYTGWVKVLGQQRADEQTADYGCDKKAFEDLPQWTSSVVSPP